MQLLIKVYLVNGEYAKAEKLATDLINDHGLHLMTQTFGTWQPSGCETTWKVTRNVVWDLHRTPNICNPQNKETIMAIINSNQGFSMVKYANSVLSYVDKVQGLKAEIRDAYKGRA